MGVVHVHALKHPFKRGVFLASFEETSGKTE